MTDKELLDETAFELRNYEFTPHAAAVVRASIRLEEVQDLRDGWAAILEQGGYGTHISLAAVVEHLTRALNKEEEDYT